MKERDLDKEYAASCLRPAALGLASSTPPTTSAVSDDEDEDSYSDDGDGRRNCFGRRKSNRVSLHEHHEIGLESNSSRGVDLPRRVDLTAKREKSLWRNPSRLHDDYNDGDGDMTKEERIKFAKYMEAGMSLEAASSQVLSERRGNQKNKNKYSGLVAPSSVTGTRTGDIGGYTGRPRTRSRGHQSSLMDCTRYAEDNSHSQSPPYASLGAACSPNDQRLLDGIRDEETERKRNRRIKKGTARAMVIAPASSYASSYDDNEFDAAMAEADVEMAMA